MADATLILVLAVAFDLAVGELPARLHPVVGIGALADRLTRRPPSGPRARLVYGAAVALAIPAIAAAAAHLALHAIAAWPPAAIAAGIYLLTSTFAVRALGAAAGAVRDALARGDLAGARRGLPALCSRDPAVLSASAVAGATTASVAENTSDSVVAPLFYLAIAGIPGAVAYRAINTLDAMIGYRGRHEHLGKVAARLDDAVNVVPARLTAGLLLCCGALLGHDARRGWRCLWRDGGRTASPNAGRPMAAMAGLLGVALDKPGAYRLGDARRPVTHDTITEAWSICRLAALAAAALAALALEAHHG